MISAVVAALMAITGVGLDLPPEGIFTAATAEAPATRGTAVQVTETAPPPVVVDVAPDGLSNCDEMSWYRQRAGLPARFDAIGWRESNCRNEDGVRTSCCHGWWQLNVSLHLRDRRLAGRYHDCGVYSYADVNSDTPGDKLRQACAARALYDTVGLSAWAATR
jgi:hypothetical protein